MPIHFPFQSNDLTVDSDAYVLPETTIQVLLNGIDVTEYLIDYNISGGRGTPITGSITLKDRTNYIIDAQSQFNQTNSAIKSHNMTDAVTIQILVSQGSVSPDYPVLIPGDPTWDNDGTLTFSFSDKTPIIDKDNQNLEDQLYDEGDIVNSDDIYANIATLAGEPISPDFTPYSIRTFRGAKKNLIAAIDELAMAVQGYRKWMDDVLHIEVLTEGSPTSSIIDRLHIPEGGMTASLDTSNLRTYFRYFRDVPLSSVLGRANCTGTLLAESPCVGRVVQLTFNRPAICARVKWTAANGTIEDGVFFDEGGLPLNDDPSEIFYGTALSKAVRWLGTYVPDFVIGGDGEYIPSWEAWADGPPLNESGGVFEAEKIITTLESLYGRRPEYKDLESELLLNPATATAMLDALETEVKWSIRKFTVTTPFLYDEREGDFLSLTHHKHGLVEQTCLLHSWSHSFSFADGWNNTYELRAKIA